MAKKLIYSDINPLPKEEIGLDYYLNHDHLLYVLPPYYEMKETIREKIWQASDNRIIELKNIISIDGLFEELYYKTAGEHQIIRQEELRYILLQLLAEEDYSFFDESSVDYILEFINEVDAELIDLQEDSSKNHILIELKEVYYALQEKLQQLGCITKWQAYQALIENLTKKDFFHLYPDIEQIFFDRLYILRPVELELIKKLAAWVDEVVILLDYHPDKPKLFSNLTYAVERLKESGFKVDNRIEEGNELVKQLFANQMIEEDKYDWQEELGSQLAVTAASNPVQELEMIAHRIRGLADKGANLSRIGLAFSVPERYQPHLARVFTEYNLPYKQQLSKPLISAPIIQEIVGVLNILTGDFKPEELLELASANFITLNVESDTEFSLPDRLAQMLKQVRFEISGWSLIEALINKSKAVADEDLAHILSNFKDKFNWQLNKKVSFDNFITKFSSLLTELRLTTKLNQYEEEAEVTAAWKGFKQVVATLQKVTPASRSLKEWIEFLKLTLQEESYTYNEGKGIEVTGKIELRSGDYDYIFLAGMSHDLYPTVHQSPLDKYLRGLGVKLRDSQVRDRYLFMDHLLAARKGIFITYSKTGNETEALPSSCIKELARVVEIDDFDLADNIYSVPDLQQRWGMKLNQGELYELDESYSWQEELLTKFKLVQDRTQSGLEAYNGKLQTESNIQWLRERFAADYNYSASFLEDYFACPFKFLFKRIFDYEELEYEEAMNHLERGDLIHEIVERFYRRLPAAKVSEAGYEAAYQVMVEVVEEIVVEKPLFAESIYWETEGKRYLQEGELGPVLEEFLDVELNGEFSSWYSKSIKTKKFQVREVEWEFSDLELISGYLFSGRIDRIHYHPEYDTLGVVDYKSGRVSNKSLNYYPFQLPIYILAVDQSFDEPVSFGSYCGLRPDDDDGVGYNTVLDQEISSTKQEWFEEDLAEAQENIIKAIENLKAGKFNLGDKDNKCDYCHCKFICRKEEV